MRHILRSTRVPTSLKGARAPLSEDEIDHRLYSAEDVKKQLLEEQYHKCAYCECRLNGDYGHIEHYRPKRGYTTIEEPFLHKPGYVWLAYEWDNLLLSCSRCNSSFKRNCFDLSDESTRNIAARDISQESPLLINPIAEDPLEHLEYRGYFLFPRIVNGVPDVKGAYTINLLGLNHRVDLVENRRRVWERHCRLRGIMALCECELTHSPENANLRTLSDTVRKQLEQMAAPEAEYSAMFIGNATACCHLSACMPRLSA